MFTLIPQISLEKSVDQKNKEVIGQEQKDFEKYVALQSSITN